MVEKPTLVPGNMSVRLWLMSQQIRKQAKTLWMELGFVYIPEDVPTYTSNLLPPARPYLLKVPQLPRTTPPVRTTLFKPMSCGRHFHSKP